MAEDVISRIDSQGDKDISYQLYNNLYPVIILTLIGTAGSIILYLFNYLYSYIRNMFISSITLTSNDDVYKFAIDFLTQQGYLQGSMTQMKCQIKKKGFVWWWNRASDENERPKVEYLPGPGNHIFTYKGQKLWAVSSEGETLLTGWERKPQKQETLTIYKYGKDNQVLKDLISDAVDYSQEKDSDLTSIYQVHRWGHCWEKCQSKKPRTLDSVVLDSNISDVIIQDIDKFLHSAEWYISKGVPYRRGYLLYGPPGTGKTSFVQAVAAQMKLNICYLNLSGGSMDDDGLNNILNCAPLRSIILLEDIDAIFVERTSVQEKMERRRNVTFSGLLNALDGVRSQEGRILIMTTNHREKLDPALLRPGRADLQIQLNYASEKQMIGLYKKFFPEESNERAQQFANQLPEFKLSMAKLQGHFLKYKEKPQEALDNAKTLLDLEHKMKDLSIHEWLRRLNMQQYTDKFKKDGFKRVIDLKYLGEGDLAAFGITALTDKKRIMEMVQGNEQAKALFAFQSKSQARSIIIQFLSDPKDIEEILSIVGEEKITGFQLRDIFDENKNFNLIIKKLKQKVEQNELFKQGLAKEKEKSKEKDEEIEKKKKSVPKDDIEGMLKSIGLAECIPKLKEKEINDPEVFYELEEGTIITALDITTEGKKFKFKEKLKQIKEKHEKKLKEEEEKEKDDDMCEIVEETYAMLQKKVSVVY